MIKKLRFKIIIVMMIAVVVVLSVIIGGINIKNYHDLTKRADSTIEILKMNDGKFPQKPMPGNNNPFEMSPELPFESRFFTITYNESNEVMEVNIDKVASINKDEAIEYGNKAIKNKKNKGFMDSYRFLVFEKENQETMIIFLDCNRELDSFSKVLNTSIIISVIGVCVVFVLVLIFSKIVTKPVVQTYQKQKSFITDASHELKTPLTIINASCEILEYNNQNNEWIKTIKDQTKRLTDLTNKLVFLSKMDEESKKAMMTDFSLSEVMNEVITSYLPLSVTTNKKIVYNILPNVSMNGDLLMIKEMLNLLIDNAFKYASSNSDININLKTQGKSKIIIISNLAENLPSGDLKILFDRFYRLDSSRNSETGGHGIGLSVVKAIVELHKGKITIFSDGKEITFTITL